VLQGVVDKGVTLCVDDFGTGWSNLAHLRDLPLTGLKLSSAFIGDPASQDAASGVSWRIVSGLVSLADSLGLTLTAEGVETPDTAERLRSLGCDWGQGWLFGRPAAPEALEALILARADKSVN
jgi:EAL domain-containing protein (putative c-di-GMP-specific phosphodiesterase class I)